MKEKEKGLLLDILIYILAFGVGIIPFIFIDDVLLASAVFTSSATIVIFCFSMLFADVSIYDPYWSVAPPVIILAVMIKYNFWTVNAFILLAVILIWAIRLTANWFITYKGLGHEDWRYAKYRERYSPFIFQFISFTGLHFIPTIVVYLGLVSGILAAQVEAFSFLSLIGVLLMLFAVCLEFVSDRSIHRFLKEHKGERKTCNVSVWKYSRHPNYLGEMSFWTGLYLYFVATVPEIWYYGLGFISIIILFMAVSIPLMEKHNLARRIDYAEYKTKTSVLFLLPNRKVHPND